jgi:hypothetical protein
MELKIYGTKNTGMEMGVTRGGIPLVLEDGDYEDDSPRNLFPSRRNYGF